jgi:integrase
MVKAHIEKRYDDSYTIVIDEGIDPTTNKRRRWAKSVKTDDITVAESEMKIILGELENGTYLRPSQTTVKEYFERWLLTTPAKKLASTTFQRYKQCINLRIVPWIGSIKVSSLTRHHLNGFYERILIDGSLKVYSKAEQEKPVRREVGMETVLYHHRVIHRILEDAIKDKLIKENPADLVDLPEPETDFDEDEGLVKVFTDDEIRALLEHAEARHKKYFPLVYVALHTGLRRGELLALSWNNINFEDKTIFVKKALVHTKEKGYEIKDLKNPKRGANKKRRKIEVVDSVLDVLHQVKAYQDEIIRKLEEKKEGLAAKVYDVKKQNLIFCRDDGQEMHPDSISSWFPDFCKEIGITRFGFHSLRHNHASHLLAAGEEISYVSKRLGHSSIVMTYNTYFHFIPTERRESLKELEKKFTK